MNPAPNLILIGPMGAGKTCIGRRLAERFTLDFVDVDQAIVDAAGASIPTIFEHTGEAASAAMSGRPWPACWKAAANWSPPAAARCWTPATAH